jgi:hypothetical protein
MEEGIFPHKCVVSGCEYTVQFDDEPWCFKHSPDSGSSKHGYSARAEAASGNLTVEDVFVVF